MAEDAAAIAETVLASTYFGFVEAELVLEDWLLPLFGGGAFGTTVWKLLEVREAPIFCIFEVVSDLVKGALDIIRFIISASYSWPYLHYFLAGVGIDAAEGFDA